MKRSRQKQLWAEGYKQGYKKALRKLRTLNESKNPLYEEAVETFATAVGECAEEGENSVEGIIDYWQQVYGDNFLYGLEGGSLDVRELATACLKGFKEAGFPTDITPQELEDIFADYLELNNKFQAGNNNEDGDDIGDYYPDYVRSMIDDYPYV